ncbi:iron-containing alcohol dehydrogenase [Geoglobus ahangari]
MWKFLAPRVIFGEDSVEFLERYEDSRPIVVTDRVMVELGHLDTIGKHLGEFEVYAAEPREPLKSDALDLAERIRELNPDIVIALGGGSVIDLAKAGRILSEVEMEPDEITPFTDLRDYGFEKRTEFIAIPTTSGTGSEASWAIVLKDEEEDRKVVMANEEVVPDYAIVDPVFVKSMPGKLVISTGFDALSHAVEAFLSTFSNPFSDALAVRATRDILENIEKSFEGDEGAREVMHISATMAGMAFSNSQVGVVHALAHAFGAVMNVPHGNAIAGFLLPVLEFYRERGVERLDELSRLVGFDVMERIGEISERFDVFSVFSEKPFDDAIPEIVEKAMQDSCVITGPFVPDAEGLENILRRLV